MSEHPTQTQPAVPTARPATTEAGPSSAAGTPASLDRESTTAYRQSWTPLLPRPVFLVLVALGIVAGIAGPILLWLNFQMARPSEFSERVGFLLVIIGLGLVMIAVPLVLGEVTRLGAASSSGVASDPRPDSRGLTGSRIVALVAIMLILAGAFLVRPADAADAGSTGGNTQGGTNNSGGGGRN